MHPGALEVEAEFTVVDPAGREIRVSARDGLGLVTMPRAALSLRDLPPLPPAAERRRWAGRLQQALAAAGLRLEIIAAGRTVARLAPAGAGNWLGRLAGLAPFEVDLRGLLAAWLFPREPRQP